MIAIIQTYFDISAEKAWETLKNKDTFLFITRGFLGFMGAKNWPEEFYEGLEINSRFVFFHFLPAWKHCLHVVILDDRNKELFSNEKGGFIETWNHLIRIEHETDKRCKYTDQVEIKAGLFTPVVWGYAHIFYRYRHYRWKKLIRKITSKRRYCSLG